MKLFIACLLVVNAKEEASEACSHGRGYSKIGAPNVTNVRDAQACKTSCTISQGCKFFMYDLESYDCWLMSKHSETHSKENSILGPINCDLDLAYLALAERLGKSQDEDRGPRVCKVVHHMAMLLEAGSLNNEVVEKDVLLKAKEVIKATQSCVRGELKKLGYEKLTDVINTAEAGQLKT